MLNDPVFRLGAIIFGSVLAGVFGGHIFGPLFVRKVWPTDEGGDRDFKKDWESMSDGTIER